MRLATTMALAMLLTILLTACTTSGGDSVRQLQAPSYATRTSAETYSVNCGGRSEVIIRRSSMDDFYHESGAMKSLAEFCEEFDPSRVIRKN